MAEKVSIKLYEKEIRTLFSLPDEQRGHIMTALLAKSIGEEQPELDAMENAVYTLIYDQIERAGELSKKRSQSVSSRYKQNTNEDLEPESYIEESVNQVQSDTNTVQNPTNGYNGDTNAYTHTLTLTNTNTLTSTDTPPISPAGDGADVRAEPPKAKQGVRTSSEDIRQRFNRFWSAYPKKQGKGAAEKIWMKLKPSEILTNQMLEALELAKKCTQWNRNRGQYIPNPATWLNQKRWEDEYRDDISANDRMPDYGPEPDIPDWDLERTGNNG